MDRVRTADRTAAAALTACAVLVALVIAAILLFVGSEGLRLFADVSPLEFFFSPVWNPPMGRFGALPFMVGSVVVTGIALLISAPLGLAGAIFMAKIAPDWMRTVLRQASNLFVGIPSVVYGYIGMTLLVPWVREHLGGQGFGVLVAGLVLAIMVMPTILGMSEDALQAVDPAIEEGSLALGATRWQTIWDVTLPAARPRILAAIILAFARALERRPPCRWSSATRRSLCGR